MKKSKYSDKKYVYYIIAIEDLEDLIAKTDKQLQMHRSAERVSNLMITQFTELKERYTQELKALLLEFSENINKRFSTELT
jgi:hypothetical protein